MRFDSSQPVDFNSLTPLSRAGISHTLAIQLRHIRIEFIFVEWNRKSLRTTLANVSSLNCDTLYETQKATDVRQKKT